MSVDKTPLDTYAKNLCGLAREGRLPHAVIIECADSAQARSAALETAENALCGSDEDMPCQKCGDCIKMHSNSHPDVKIISPERGNSKSIKIDDIRFIREDAYIASSEGSYKFYILADADYLTVQAQNALIKILEEPPAKVIFIILCKSSLSLLETVRSRSQIFKIGSENVQESRSLEKDLANSIAHSGLKNDRCEIIKLISSVPNDRLFLKNLIDDIIKSLFSACFQKNHTCKDYKTLMKTVTDLKYTASLVDKNINFNLLTCYLCACL